MTDYTLFVDLAKEVQPPEKGILSRTLFNDDRLKVVIFGFGQGEELSEHTASMPAILALPPGRGDRDAGRRQARGESLAPGSTCRPVCATASRRKRRWSCCCCW